MGAVNVKETKVYKLAFDVSMEIFEISKSFLVEERYALTDQMRRSSQSVCINLQEGYRKKIYQAHFKSKISDSDMENSETLSWLDFALACKYISEDTHQHLAKKNHEIGRLLNHMLNNPERY